MSQARHATAEQFYAVVSPSAGRCWGVPEATFKNYALRAFPTLLFWNEIE
jgi:hypothetical protein